jgi:hypothetical protein
MPRPKATQCPQGHAYDEVNTYLHSGRQHCKTCRRNRVREWEAANPDVKTANNAQWREANRDASRSASKRWAEANPAKRRAALIRRYGITPERFDEMFDAQGGCCAICGGTDSGDSRFDTLHIDHDHESGTVRGLLCGRCNRGVGMFQDDPDRLLAAATYLLQNVDLLKGAI